MNIWDVLRPDENSLVVMKSPGILTGGAMSNKNVLGPNLFDNESVTHERCRDWLGQNAFPCLCLLQEDYTFKRNSAPVRYSNRGTSYLSSKCHKDWIERDVAAALSVCSRRLTPFDFFLQGLVS